MAELVEDFWTMNVVLLTNAAKLADELSASRHKQIRLILTPGGVLVDGVLFRADGVVMQHYRTDLTWPQIEGDPEALETLIRKQDRKIVSDWRNEPPAKEP
jgi:hypothetical protein